MIRTLLTLKIRDLTGYGWILLLATLLAGLVGGTILLVWITSLFPQSSKAGKLLLPVAIVPGAVVLWVGARGFIALGWPILKPEDPPPYDQRDNSLQPHSSED